MRKILNSSLFILTSCLIFLSACKKEGTDVTLLGGKAPVLKASLSDSIPLSSATAGNQAITFSWTNPNYQFSNGISSLNVTYTLQFDTAGANFTSPNMQSIQISPDLGTSFTVNDFNSLIANKLLLSTGQSHTVQVRVVASIAPYTSGSPNVAPIASNVLTFKVTPYLPPPVVTPPPSGQLYLVGGDATLGAWQNGGSYAVQSQAFTKVSNTLYTITVQLTGGDNTSGNDQYLFVPVWGDWSNKYACQNTSQQSPSGGVFGYNGGNGTWNANFPGPTAPGTYTITVNFQTGTYTVVKQ